MAYLLAKDTVTGAEGSVVVTKEGRNYVVAGMRNITTNAEIQSSDMRVIGTRTIQDKPNGAKLTGTGTIYYGTNLWTDMVLQYQLRFRFGDTGLPGYGLLRMPPDRHRAPLRSE